MPVAVGPSVSTETFQPGRRGPGPAGRRPTEATGRAPVPAMITGDDEGRLRQPRTSQWPGPKQPDELQSVCTKRHFRFKRHDGMSLDTLKLKFATANARVSTRVGDGLAESEAREFSLLPEESSKENRRDGSEECRRDGFPSRPNLSPT